MPLTPRFHRLRVAEVRRETADAVSITFEVPPDLRAAYAFAAGQYLTLRAAPSGLRDGSGSWDGAALRRSYSICAAPGDGELRIAIKRVDGGRFSVWAQSLAAGDALDVMTPTGRFGLRTAPNAAPDGSPDDARTIAAFAAGSGITPILSIVRDVLAREARSRVVLFYGNARTGDMLFRDALEQLKDRHMGRLSVFHVLSREQQDVPVLNGRLDAEKVRLLLRHVVPAALIDDAFVCGPEGMIDAVDATLRELGVPPGAIHVERFVSALGGVPRAGPAIVAADAPFATAGIVAEGRRTAVPVARGESLLDAALRAGLDLPYACKGGMCSTCRARVTEGSAPMALNFSLEPWEVAAGYVLTCQAHPETRHVVVDYDQV